MDMLVKKAMICVCWRVFQCQRPHRVEQDRSLEFSRQNPIGIRLMIIELKRYNEIGTLLIENRVTGLQGHIHYGDGCQRVSVTRGGCPLGGGRDRDAKQATGAHTNQPPSQE